ncbi:glycosyltransferase family 15 protein, partial [Ascoidea rubescens DSM 1968]
KENKPIPPKVPISQRYLFTKFDQPFYVGCMDTDLISQRYPQRANAALVVLARNKEVGDVIKSMDSLERHFNQWFNYPWVFLNDKPFTDDFKKTVLLHTSSQVEFGLVSESLWEFPIKKSNQEDKETKNVYEFDESIYKESINSQGDRGIMYGLMPSYHKMCRFYSGKFYKHPLLKKYKWYWRVEPNVQFFCDLTYDPFIEMEKNNKKYGFTVLIKELTSTIPNLFRITQAFIKKNNIQTQSAWSLFVNQMNNFKFPDANDNDNRKLLQRYKNIKEKQELIDSIENNIQIDHLVDIAKEVDNDSKLDPKVLQSLIDKSSRIFIPEIQKDYFNNEEYNFCHFWSNFEIARLDIWDNDIYDQYFEYLDQSGGFFKERWGDAPVHTLALGMFLNLTDLHYFRDIGYKHTTLGHCPSNSFDNHLPYKMKLKSDNKFLNYDLPQKNGIGCRCKCPNDHKDIENSPGSCINDWVRVNKD